MDNTIKITAIVVAGVIVLGLIASLTFSSFSPSNTISMRGTSTVEAMPDLIGIYFSVQTIASTSEEATQENAEIVDDLKLHLMALGYNKEDIVSTGFNVYPEYDWVNGERIEKGFQATHSIKLEISSEDSGDIGEVVDAGVSAGAGISYINFELSQELESQYKAQAMELAARDSKVKAEATAKGFDKKLGKLVSTSVNDYYYSPWRVYSGSGMVEDAVMAKEATTDIQPGETQISASVTAVYKLI